MTKRIVAVVLTFAFCFSCRPKEGEATGDEARSGAKEIRPGVLYDDKVAARGDPVDFKRFEVTTPTPCIVNVYWDNPGVEAKVVLRDQFGGLVAEVQHAKGANKDSLGPVTLREGIHFLEIAAKSGASVYTIELFLGSPEEGGTEAFPWPE